MNRNCLTKPTRIFAGLLTGLLLAILAIPLGAATAPKSQVGRGYDAAHETTLTGTIQEVVTKRTVGSPAGMHLLVAGPQGVVDAHLGPFLSKQTREALQAGMPVQIVGASVSLHGKDYFLARQMIFSGRTVTIRSTRGALVQPHSQGQRIVKVRDAGKVETKGGAQ